MNSCLLALVVSIACMMFVAFQKSSVMSTVDLVTIFVALVAVYATTTLVSSVVIERMEDATKHTQRTDITPPPPVSAEQHAEHFVDASSHRANLIEYMPDASTNHMLISDVDTLQTLHSYTLLYNTFLSQSYENPATSMALEDVIKSDDPARNVSFPQECGSANNKCYEADTNAIHLTAPVTTVKADQMLRTDFRSSAEGDIKHGDFSIVIMLKPDIDKSGSRDTSLFKVIGNNNHFFEVVLAQTLDTDNRIKLSIKLRFKDDGGSDQEIDTIINETQTNTNALMIALVGKTGSIDSQGVQGELTLWINKDKVTVPPQTIPGMALSNDPVELCGTGSMFLHRFSVSNVKLQDNTLITMYQDYENIVNTMSQVYKSLFNEYITINNQLKDLETCPFDGDNKEDVCNTDCKDVTNWTDINSVFQPSNKACMERLKTYCRANPGKFCAIFQHDTVDNILKATNQDLYDIVEDIRSNGTGGVTVDNIILDKTIRTNNGVNKLMDDIVIQTQDGAGGSSDSKVNTLYDAIDHIVPETSGSSALDIKTVTDKAQLTQSARPASSVSLLDTESASQQAKEAPGMYKKTGEVSKMTDSEYETILKRYQDRTSTVSNGKGFWSFVSDLFG